MKRNLGSVLALYPMPLVIVGTMIEGKPNYALVGHVGIIGLDRILISLSKRHYTNQGIKETKALTVSLVNEAMLKKADQVGCVSGREQDKSKMYAFHLGETGSPIIEESPVVMECHVEDIYRTEDFENFICKIVCVHAEASVLNEKGQIDYHLLKPVLFERIGYEYIAMGEVIGKCRHYSDQKDG